MSVLPQHLLVDYLELPACRIPQTALVKGDARSLSIAAASILAKTYRDDHMQKLAAEYPEYDWQKNKGYPTKKHRDTIIRIGQSPYHRRSFRVTDPQISIF